MKNIIIQQATENKKSTRGEIMKLSPEKINTEPKFEKDELMRLFVCLAILQADTKQEQFESDFAIYQGATFYLAHRIGAVLEEHEKEMIDEFAINILKINAETK